MFNKARLIDMDGAPLLREPGGHILNALNDAIMNKPDGPTWFWFNNTPAPIYTVDTPQQLSKRWTAWRQGYQTTHHGLLGCLQELNKGGN